VVFSTPVRAKFTPDCVASKAAAVVARHISPRPSGFPPVDRSRVPVHRAWGGQRREWYVYGRAGCRLQRPGLSHGGAVVQRTRIAMRQCLPPGTPYLPVLSAGGHSTVSIKAWIPCASACLPASLSVRHFTIIQIACILTWLLLSPDFHFHLASTSVCHSRFSRQRAFQASTALARFPPSPDFHFHAPLTIF
jgi:hypothetical protein